jgi:hypothetical protein
MGFLRDLFGRQRETSNQSKQKHQPTTNSSNELKAERKIDYSIRVWDCEKLIGWKPGTGKTFADYPAFMFSTIIRNMDGCTQIFDGDIVSFDDELYLVNHHEDYLDYPEGSEYTITGINHRKAYGVTSDWPNVKVVANIFEPAHKMSVPKYLRQYKERLLRSIGIPVVGIPDLNSLDIISNKEQKKMKRNELLDGFKVTEVPAFLAESLESQGVLNIGLCCPVCGLVPVSKDSSWPHHFKWKNGVKLNLCEACSMNYT